MTKFSENDIADLLNLLYEAAAETNLSLWMNFYHNLAQKLSSTIGNLNIFDSSDSDFNMMISTSDAAFDYQYFEHYHQINPLLPSLAQAKSGKILLRSEVHPNDRFLRTEIYQDFFRPQEVFYLINPVIYKEQTLFAGMTFTRPQNAPDFNRNEIRLLEYLMPHLQRAFRLYTKIANLQKAKDVIEEMLDRAPQNAVAVNKIGRIVHLNRGAKAIFAQNDGLSINRQGFLQADAAQTNSKLRRLINGVLELKILSADSKQSVLNIPRKSGLRPFSIFAAPYVKRSLLETDSEPVAILFISDPETKVETVEEVLMEIYALTPAESRLAALLAQGKTIGESCDILRVTDNTARTHLKRIFSKTGTRRQTDLVKLLLNIPAVR